MSWYKPSTIFDKVFEGGLIIKGIDGSLELLGGLILLFTTSASIHRFLTFITQREISTDPNDKIAHLILHSADNLNGSNKLFLIIYLWLHAAIKLISVVGILKNWLWAYPFALISLGALLLYQFYAIAVKASIGMILLTLFDIFIIFMIWKEYGRVKAINTKLEAAEAKAVK